MKHPFSDVNSFRHKPLDLFKRYGDGRAPALVRLSLGLSPVYLVTDAAIAKAILKADEAFIDKGRLVQKLKTVIGESSITLSGPEHQKRRAIIHQHLARGIMNQFIPEITGLIREHILKLLKQESFDAHAITAPLALRVVVSLLFGKGVLTAADESALMEAVYVAEEEMAEMMFRVLPRTPWRALSRKRAVRESRELMSLVVARVQEKATNDSLIAALQALNLSPEEIRDEILLLLLAGHHTTGNAAAWVLYFLATQEGLAEQLALEAKKIVGEGGEIDPLRLPKAELSLRLAREVLRLYPPFYWLSRETRQPVELAGVNLNGGTSLIISPWLIQRDTRYWDEPDQFRLDRSYNSVAFLPFGLGPRACVGIGLGLLELQLLALEVAGSCLVERVSSEPLQPAKPRVTLLPPPIELRLRPSSIGQARTGFRTSMAL
jgi:cytochrome P450